MLKVWLSFFFFLVVFHWGGGDNLYMQWSQLQRILDETGFLQSLYSLSVSINISTIWQFLQWDTWLYVYIFNMGVIIQISTGTVMKYHVSVDCQQSYIFRKCAALKENIVPRENINLLAPPARDISSVPVDICYIR